MSTRMLKRSKRKSIDFPSYEKVREKERTDETKTKLSILGSCQSMIVQSSISLLIFDSFQSCCQRLGIFVSLLLFQDESMTFQTRLLSWLVFFCQSNGRLALISQD